MKDGSKRFFYIPMSDYGNNAMYVFSHLLDCALPGSYMNILYQTNHCIKRIILTTVRNVLSDFV